jgi:hypothetical protein
LKQCKKCELWKVKKEEFTPSASKGSGGWQNVCRLCAIVQSRTYYHTNRQKVLSSERKIRWQLRLEIIKAYGGKCECCGETIPEFLTIDHVHGGGTKHRESIGGTKALYRLLQKQGWPREGYRLLCYNCNCARGAFGTCPHQRK